MTVIEAMTATEKADRRRWEPMRLEALGNLATVVHSMTGSLVDCMGNGYTFAGSGKEWVPGCMTISVG
jgi:hypothetical protein